MSGWRALWWSQLQSGIVQGQMLGDLDVNGNEITTTEVDGDIVLRPDGAGAVVIIGDLNVSGSVTTTLSETVLIEDNIVVLNSGHIGPPTLDAGVSVERGDETDASFIWDETLDKWVAGLAGSEAAVVLAGDNISLLTNDAGYLKNVVEDLTPQLGGNLDLNGFNIVTAAGAVAADINIIGGNSTAGEGADIIIRGGQDNGDVTLEGGAGGAVSAAGGWASVRGGNASTDGIGGQVLAQAGAGDGAGTGGPVLIKGGTIVGAGDGGNIELTPGSSTAGSHGHVLLNQPTTGATCEVRFEALNGTNYTGLKAGGATEDALYTLPLAYPASSGDALVSTDAGVMSWAGVVINPMTADLDTAGYKIKTIVAAGDSPNLEFETADAASNAGDYVVTLGNSTDGSGAGWFKVTCGDATVGPNSGELDIRSGATASALGARFSTSGGSMTLQPGGGDGGNDGSPLWLRGGNGDSVGGGGANVNVRPGSAISRDDAGALDDAGAFEVITETGANNTNASTGTPGDAGQITLRTERGGSITNASNDNDGGAGGNILLQLGPGGTAAGAGSVGQQGYILIQSDVLQAQSVSPEVRFVEGGFGAGGDDYVAFKVLDDLSGVSTTYTLPSAYPGTSGDALVSTDAGVMSWASVLTDIVQDTTPQLGATLDPNGFNIEGAAGSNTASISIQVGTVNSGGFNPQFMRVKGGNVVDGATAGGAGDASIIGGDDLRTSVFGFAVGGDSICKGGAATNATLTQGVGGNAYLEGGDGWTDGGWIYIKAGRDLQDASADGKVEFQGATSTVPAEFQMREAVANGSEHVKLTVPASIGSSQTWILPDAGDTPAGQVAGWDLGEFTLAGLPAAASYPGCRALVTNASGGRTMTRSDGTNWKIIAVEGATVT